MAQANENKNWRIKIEEKGNGRILLSNECPYRPRSNIKICDRIKSKNFREFSCNKESCACAV